MPSESFRVVVTVKVVEVPCREVSVVTTLMVRPLIEIQLAVGDMVSVSVEVQSVSCVHAPTVQEYGPEPMVEVYDGGALGAFRLVGAEQAALTP